MDVPLSNLSAQLVPPNDGARQTLEVDYHLEIGADLDSL